MTIEKYSWVKNPRRLRHDAAVVSRPNRGVPVMTRKKKKNRRRQVRFTGEFAVFANEFATTSHMSSLIPV